MPILFACVVNAKKKIIVSGIDPQFKSNYKDNVLEYADKFVLFGRKTIALDEKYNLHYM